MHHFQIVDRYFSKKYRRENQQKTADSSPQWANNDTPIPSLQINNVFRRRAFNNHSGLGKYFFEFEIASQAVLILIVIISVGVYIFNPDIFGNIMNAMKSQKESTAAITAAEQKIRQSVAKKVYANSVPIDADRIFSAPASDITLVAPGVPKKEVYGFFPYWMLERQEQINFDALTTIALFGLDVDGQGNIMTATGDGQPNPGWEMWHNPALTKLLSRAKREDIAVEVALKAFNNKDIESIALSDDAQKKMIANAIYLMQSKALQGVNLDFEYTGTPDQAVTDGFTRLVTNLRAEMLRQAPGSTLTVDTYVNAGAIRGLFDIAKLAEQTDSLVIMGYDIHTPSGDPGPVAPLEGQVSILGFLQSYLEKVAPEKMVLAVPYYGYDWNRNNDSQSAYMLSYAEIAEMSKDKAIGWDENGKTPFFNYVEEGTGQERVVHFENVRSLGEKYDFINAKNLKGVGIWALGYDGQNAELHNILIEKFTKN
jgi:spore germination protein YaaH